MKRSKYGLIRKLVKIIDPRKGEKIVFGDYDKKRTNPNRIKRPNIVWEITWRFLVVCLVIDSGIYAYFELYKKQDVWEGLKELQYTLLNRKQIHQGPVHHVKYYPKEYLSPKTQELYTKRKKPIT